MELTGRNFEKARDRFLASTRTQFNLYHSNLRNFINPLNAGQKCKRILLDKNKLMNSKMRPQMLFFENADHGLNPELDDIAIMYKKGDDLRQDRYISRKNLCINFISKKIVFLLHDFFKVDVTASVSDGSNLETRLPN